VLKKTITYEDLDGGKITEDFYFALSKAELAEMRLRQGDGFDGFLKAIVAAKDGNALMDLFKNMLRMSVGKRSADGKRFIKNDEIVDEFMQTDAYSVLFMELVTDADKASEFVRGLVPRDLAPQAAQAVQQARQDHGLPLTDAPDISSVPQPEVSPQPTPFPQSLEAAVVATHENTVDPSASEDPTEPAWYREGRYPTKKELMAMGTEEMQLAMKLRSAKAFG
jgi:hypothetical protein